MGLDITAYTKLTIVPSEKVKLDEDGQPTEDYLKFHDIIYTEQTWPGRTEGLVSTFYEAEDTFGFRAGSYSGYSHWRDWLAKLAGFASAQAVWSDPEAAGPFVELINFSDCEGVIGPVVSAKLAKDFAVFREKAKAILEGGWFYEAYLQWEKAFQLAADNGAVEFH